jgi:Peptidase family M1 domain
MKWSKVRWRLRMGVVEALTLSCQRTLAIGVASALLFTGSPDDVAAAEPIPVTSRCTVGVQTPFPIRPRYDVTMTFDPAPAKVVGHVTISFKPERSISEVVLRLWPNGGVRDTTAPRMTFSNLTIQRDGSQGGTKSPVTGFRKPDPTLLSFDVAAKANVEVTIDLDFVTSVGGERNDRISVSKRSGAFVSARFGSFIPVLAWEPGVGWNRTPPTKSGAEASMTTAADWDVHLGLPSSSGGLSILGSGEEIEPGHWTSSAQRDWAMSIGRWNASDDSFAQSTVSLGPGRRTVDVQVAVVRPLTESASAYRSRVVRAIRSLSNRYGDFPWPTYTLVIAPGLRGGIEYPSHVMQGPGSTGRTTTHEVAHQWFYALVGNDQGHDPWIDEGLATWAEARTENTVDSFVAKSIPADSKGKAGSPMTYWDAHRNSYYRGVYVQTLQALAALGDADRVDCALQALVTTGAYRVVRPADVVAALLVEFPNAEVVLRQYGLSP